MVIGFSHHSKTVWVLYGRAGVGKTCLLAQLKSAFGTRCVSSGCMTSVAGLLAQIRTQGDVSAVLVDQPGSKDFSEWLDALLDRIDDQGDLPALWVITTMDSVRVPSRLDVDVYYSNIVYEPFLPRKG